MPNLKQMIDEKATFSRLSNCVCPRRPRLPGGIMFGDNHDIPPSAGTTKDEQRLFGVRQCGRHHYSRYCERPGLMLAERASTTCWRLTSGEIDLDGVQFQDRHSDEKKRRAEDIYLLALNPYFLMRVIVLFLAEVFWKCGRLAAEAQEVDPGKGSAAQSSIRLCAPR